MKLIAEKLSKSFGTNTALSDFSAEFEPGIYALLGPNGAGKSTLMNIITGNLRQDSGRILFADENGITAETGKMGAEFRKRLGYMPQYTGLYPDFSVERFLWYIAALKNVGGKLNGKARKKLISDSVSDVLTAVGLDNARRKRIGTLSGGMKQRLALAQAVLGDPDVVVLDEPTAGLDPEQRIAIKNYISSISLNKIVIIATHIVSDVEFISKRIILMKKGGIVDNSTPSELVNRISGKVWLVPGTESGIDSLKEKYVVTGIADGNGTPLLRIVSDTRPTENSVCTLPALEDYCLFALNGGMGK